MVAGNLQEIGTRNGGVVRSAKGDTTPFFSSLDSLRGIAALTVVVFHAAWTNPISALRFFQNGALMVDFFFVLSGFVICHSYGSRLNSISDVGRFMWLRLGRLYPLHLTFLLVFVAFKFSVFFAKADVDFVSAASAFARINAVPLLTNVLLIQSLGTQHALTFNFPSWSISTELYAYLLFAILRERVGRGRAFVASALAIVFASGGLLIAYGPKSLVDAMIRWGFSRCCAGFFLGVLVAHLYKRMQLDPISATNRLRAAAQPAAFAIVLWFLGDVNPGSRLTYVFPVLAAAIVLSTALYPSDVLNKVFLLDPLRWLGRISYSVYMTHAAVGWVIAQLLVTTFNFPKTGEASDVMIATPDALGLGLLIGYVAIVLVLSHYTFLAIEEPFRRRSREVINRLDSVSGAQWTAIVRAIANR